jgi:hypothetical protein
MENNKKQLKNFNCNKLNDYSKISGGDGEAERKKVIDSGITPCGDTYQIIGHFFLGIHYGTDEMVSDPSKSTK